MIRSVLSHLKCWWRGWHTFRRYDIFDPVACQDQRVPPTVCVCDNCGAIERVYAG